MFGLITIGQVSTWAELITTDGELQQAMRFKGEGHIDQAIAWLVALGVSRICAQEITHDFL